MIFANFVELIFYDALTVVWLGLPLLLASIIEVFLWKTTLFEYLNYPINIRLFGRNKRWRGLVSLPIAHLIGVWMLQRLEISLGLSSDQIILLSDHNTLFYGLLVGFVFNLSELPISFIKRRLNIPPGTERNGLFSWIDHMDSPYGVLLALYFYLRLPIHLLFNALWMGPVTFAAATWLRKKIGAK